MGNTSSQICKAAEDGNELAVTNAVMSGQDVNELDGTSYGWIPMHYAVHGKHPSMIRKLANLGGNVNKRSAGGLIYGMQTPLMLAADKGLDDCFYELLRCGANVDLADQSRWTALHYAVRSKSPAMVAALIEKHANVNVLTTGNDSALDMALKAGVSGIVEQLLPRCSEDRVIAALDVCVDRLHMDPVLTLLRSGRVPRLMVSASVQRLRARLLALRQRIDERRTHQHHITALSELNTLKMELNALSREESDVVGMMDLLSGYASSGSVALPAEDVISQLGASILSSVTSFATSLFSSGEARTPAQTAPSASSYTSQAAPSPPVAVRRASVPARAAGSMPSTDSAPSAPISAPISDPVPISVSPEVPACDPVSTSSECSVCLTNAKNAAVDPCGHMLCYSCAVEIHSRGQSCPMCRQRIHKVLKVFG